MRRSAMKYATSILAGALLLMLMICAGFANWRENFDDYYFSVVAAPSTMVAHWLMNDNSANTTVADKTGKYNGTAQSNTCDISVTGKINRALSFNGSSDWITIGTGQPWDNLCSATNPLTLACWFYAYPIGYGNAACFLGKGNDPHFFYFGMLTYGITEYGNNIVFAIKNGANSKTLWVQSADATRYNETWTHYAVTYDGSKSCSGVQLYVNGVNVSGEIILDGFEGVFSHTQPFSLGLGYGDESTKCDGYLDDMRVYDRVLTSNEIFSIYNSGNGTEN